MRYGQRMQSDSQIMRGNNAYHGHNHQQSHDTYASNGSDSTGPWANSTDPSSENSSIERMNAAAKPYSVYDNVQTAGNDPRHRNDEPPRPPAHSRHPLSFANQERGPPVPQKTSLPPATRAEPDKKKNWLSRRFSKKL